MEIERKFLVNEIPFDPNKFPHSEITQSYISRDPVIRLRKRDADFILTVKGAGHIEREEFELPLTQAQYERLLQKTEAHAIQKTRYLVPLADGCTAELDIYHSALAGLKTAEVEFKTADEAQAFAPPAWFGEDVSEKTEYTNASLSTT